MLWDGGPRGWARGWVASSRLGHACHRVGERRAGLWPHADRHMRARHWAHACHMCLAWLPCRCQVSGGTARPLCSPGIGRGTKPVPCKAIASHMLCSLPSLPCALCLSMLRVLLSVGLEVLTPSPFLPSPLAGSYPDLFLVIPTNPGLQQKAPLLGPHRSLSLPSACQGPFVIQ